MSSFVHQRNTHRHAGNTLKRPLDNPGGYGGRIGGFQEEDRSRYAPPPQKRPRYQTQPQFQSGTPPLYNRRHQHDDSNLSRVSNYGDVINSNSSNISTFTHRNSQSNADYQKPYGYGNPNPQSVPLPLPYRKLDGFDSLPEWVPNFAPNTNRDVTGVRFNANPPLSQAPPVFTNLPNSMPLTHSNMDSVVSQSLPQQPIVSKELADLLSVLNNKEKEKECDLGLDFDKINLNVRHESVVKSLYSDMPRQCSSCGVRFKCQEEHSKHMDWHVRKNRMAKDATKAMTTRVSQKPKKSRDWFASSSLWLSAATGATVEGAKPAFGGTQKTKEEEKQQQHMVHADENQKMCALCLESLEEFFSHEEDDWMYRDAVYLHMNGSGPIAHVKCMPEPRKAPAKESTKPVMVAASAVVC
ncbi:Polyadenylation and cleavage factor-like protein 5 [Raphanus sativus]|uniref:Polyadenylation and cleavage factor homolog 5-like n=1 Tax=Raphanus sativus TaxID=3726 RepID=A0A6J0KAM9_RAPSA|nr:polyadenylation and cleavage factor homolog 5-like [Raphanus sativus]KAJ4884089.1 Polyadenylation and cleavage factor-like protein 5 [Raphanus sativus]